VELGAEFVVGAGWERPEWFAANAALVPSDAPWVRRGEWAARFWSPIEGAEHLATRSSAALFDLTAFAKFDVEGPDALAYLERICANRIDRPVGTIAYTAMLTPTGGIRCDLTITRKQDELFRVITGGGSGQHDLAWMRRQIAEGERVRITERTGSLFALGLWGPSAREVLSAVTDADVGNDAFPYMTARYLNVGEVGPVWAQRISYAGELGWELTTATEWAVAVWDRLRAAGSDAGLEPFGYRALESLRMEKGYRYFGTDLTMLETPFEAGLGAFVRLDVGSFIGREALLGARKSGGVQGRGQSRPARRLRTLAIGGPEYVPVYGGEAVRDQGEVVGRLRSVAYGPTVERTIGYVYLPETVGEGAPLEIDVFDTRVDAVVAPDALVDPLGERMRG